MVAFSGQWRLGLGILSSQTEQTEQKGTECNGMIANAGVAAVASTIFVRIALGTLLERFGPVNVQASLLTFGAFWVAMAAAISAPWNYALIRFFIGCAGPVFVLLGRRVKSSHLV